MANPPRTFGICSMEHLTAADIEAYRLSRKMVWMSVLTRNHDIKLLRQAWNSAMRHRLVQHTPFRYQHLVEIQLEPEAGRHMRFEREDDEARLLAASSPHLHDVIVGLLETTCRPGEILSLQWADVNLLQREITIRAGKAKTRRDRLMPISQRLLAVLECAGLSVRTRVAARRVCVWRFAWSARALGSTRLGGCARQGGPSPLALGRPATRVLQSI